MLTHPQMPQGPDNCSVGAVIVFLLGNLACGLLRRILLSDVDTFLDQHLHHAIITLLCRHMNWIRGLELEHGFLANLGAREAILSKECSHGLLTILCFLA